ncbi:MAG: tellurite resistance protein TerC [Myxococcota bacterium]
MIAVWIVFFVFIAFLLALDLGVLNRTSHVIGMREATVWSAIWISTGLAFSGLVYLGYENHWGGLGTVVGHNLPNTGTEAVMQYITAFLIEKSLSVDNIFVMAMLFGYFKVPSKYQHKVLFWGIIGALFFRGIMIAVGVALVQQFDWIFYVFGVFLIITAVRMLMSNDEEFDPDTSRIIRWARKVLPLVERYEGDRFVVTIDGKRYFTLLFLCVLVIEGMDVVFAIDSIPAIFGFTEDAFIVMTSNVFAILGLRALYFVVAGAMRHYRYLEMAVSAILVLVGIKMLLHSVLEIAPHWPLIGVVAMLTAGVVASIVANKREARAATSESIEHADAAEPVKPAEPVEGDAS